MKCKRFAVEIVMLALTLQGAAQDSPSAPLAARPKEADLTAAEQGAEDWLARLRPYIIGPGQPGHQPDRFLVPSAAPEKEEMQKRLGIYAEAVAALAEYKKAGPGALATDELKQTAILLETALARFETSCRQYAEEDLRAADAAIRRMEQFIREQDNKKAAQEPYHFLERDQLLNAQALVDRAAGLLKAGDQRINALTRRLDGLKRSDAQLRAALISETRMQPEAYAGDDIEDLKKSAEQFVLRAQPGVRILKTTLTSPDWIQESVIEWTDLAQTTLWQRTTRRLTAQVAGKRNADTLLYTLHIGQDRQADGGWGPRYGRVIFTDPILEENIR